MSGAERPCDHAGVRGGGVGSRELCAGFPVLQRFS